MTSIYKIGDIVVRRTGSPRMKVTGVGKQDGRIRCSWRWGPTTYTQFFEVDDLERSNPPPVAATAPTAARKAKRS